MVATRRFTAYVKQGKGVKELGVYSTRKGSPGSIAKKAVTSACRVSKAKTCKRSILVREHGTAAVREYAGSVSKLAKPQKVQIGGRDVTFRKSTNAKYLRTMHV